jgi:hypothetical protein
MMNHVNLLPQIIKTYLKLPLSNGEAVSSDTGIANIGLIDIICNVFDLYEL